MTVALSPVHTSKGISKNVPSVSQYTNYSEAEQQFIQLLASENLDQQVTDRPELVTNFEATITTALSRRAIGAFKHSYGFLGAAYPGR